MTKQQLFDKVWRGLKRQGFNRSLGTDDICRYRGTNGMKCAAGHLLLDKYYKFEFEGYGLPIDGPYTKDKCGLRRMPIISAFIASGVSKSQLPLVAKLQAAHDNSSNPKGMAACLIEIAKKHKLKAPKMSKKLP